MSVIKLTPSKPTKLLPPALSVGSLVSVGYSTVRLGVDDDDDDGITTVAIGTTAELMDTVELINSVEFERAISMPEGLNRKVWPSCSVAKSPSFAKVVPPTLNAPGDPSTTSAVTVSDPAARGTKVGSALAGISVNGICESEDTNTKLEDSALTTKPLIVATGSSERKVWPPTTTAPGTPDACDAVIVRSAAASVEYPVGTACTTDGSVNSAELSSSGVVEIDKPVKSVVAAGSWIEREDVNVMGSLSLEVCGSRTVEVEVVPVLSPCPVESGCSWDRLCPADVVVGSRPLLGPVRLLLRSSVLPIDESTLPDVIVVVANALCVKCDCVDSDKAESALCKTDKTFKDADSGWYEKGKLVVVVSSGTLLSAVDGGTNELDGS
jgi:hypothetical protein